jgi:agmatinase
MSENTQADASSLQHRACDSSFFKFPTFMGCKLSQNFLSNDVDVVISGVPFDLSSTERPGARFGPAAIRQSLMKSVRSIVVIFVLILRLSME